jgi:energy-coupling factor transport system ATP-binding protein
MAESVSIESLSFAYRGREALALKDISARVEGGTFVALMGHGGAGKSTLCCAMNGLVPRFFRGDYRGEVAIDGKKVSGCSIVDLSRMVGLVLQDFEAQLFSTNVELEVAFGPENQNLSRDAIRERIDRCLAFVGLESMRNRDSATLSGGQKQRLAIASVLAMEPGVLVMDEPVTDLDPKGRESILSISDRLREEGRTLIVADNEPENISKADYIWLMKDGEIVARDLTAKVLSDAGLLEACGVMVPPTVSLFHALGWPGSPLTFGEARRLITEHGLMPPRKRAPADDIVGPASTSEPVLSARDLSFRYEGSQADSLSAVHLDIRQGEFVAILGQNGSGKTTLAKHFNGILKPTSGVMLVAGKPAGAYRKRDLARRVGYVFQNPDHQIFASTVREEVGFGLKVLGEDRRTIEENVGRALAATGLVGYEERSPFLLTRGERQRVAVASVLAVRPEVIVLDEPTTGLDYTYQAETMGMLRDLNSHGHTIIIITHAMWIAESFASRTVVMRQGTIIADGPTRRVFADEENLSKASLAPSALVRLSNWLGTGSLTVGGMAEELTR